MRIENLAGDIDNALGFCNPNCPRSMWIEIGMSIKSGLGEGGFSVFRDWSSGGVGFNERDTLSAWRSFSASGGISISTLFYYAMDGGYDPSLSLNKESKRNNKSSSSLLHHQEEEHKKLMQRQKIAKNQSIGLWNLSSHLDPSHPYLIKKHIENIRARCIHVDDVQRYCGWKPSAMKSLDGQDKSFYELRDQLIMVPLINGMGRASIEFIDGIGAKSSLPGQGTRSGLFYSDFSSSQMRAIAESNASVRFILCEGFATQCSIRSVVNNVGHENSSVIDIPVACGSDSMYSSVIKSLSALFSQAMLDERASLMIIGDKPKNEGALTATMKLSKTHDVFFPPLSRDDVNQGLTDFNDYVLSYSEYDAKEWMHRVISGKETPINTVKNGIKL